MLLLASSATHTSVYKRAAQTLAMHDELHWQTGWMFLLKFSTTYKTLRNCPRVPAVQSSTYID